MKPIVYQVDLIERAKNLLEGIYDDTPCWLDHHGYCQEHVSFAIPCYMVEIREWLNDYELKYKIEEGEENG